jgi:signal transduction histidine kinase
MARLEDDLPLQIEQVLDRMTQQARQRGVKLEMQIPPKLVPAVLAPRFFAEILLRLVDNGIKFARPAVDSWVCVSAENRENEIEFVVSDNGIGIPVDQIERIFDPLIQVDRSWHEQQGVGLGLPVARGLVELHGGTIWAESQTGEGTRVHFSIPRNVNN